MQKQRLEVAPEDVMTVEGWGGLRSKKKALILREPGLHLDVSSSWGWRFCRARTGYATSRNAQLLSLGSVQAGPPFGSREYSTRLKSLCSWSTSSHSSPDS